MAVLAFALLFAGCAAGELPFPPTLTVQLPQSEYGTFALLIYDETGLVQEGQSVAVTDGAIPAEVTVEPAGNVLTVTWTGDSCSHQPYLRLRGDATDLDLIIAPMPIEMSMTPALRCKPVGLLSSTTLVLDEPVTRENVSITEIR